MRKQRVVSTLFNVVDPDGKVLKTVQYRKAGVNYINKHPLADALVIVPVVETTEEEIKQTEGEEVNG